VHVGQPFENAVAVVPDNQWGETSLTWSTRPASGPAFAGWVVRQGEPVEFDVTRFVQEALAGGKMLSLRLFAPRYQRGKSFVQYGSRKGDAEARPQLLVTPAP
jgi:hyaluronate lyase